MIIKKILSKNKKEEGLRKNKTEAYKETQTSSSQAVTKPIAKAVVQPIVKQVTRSVRKPANRKSSERSERKPTTKSAQASATSEQQVSKAISCHDNPSQRVGVFVDTSNLYHSAKALYKTRVNFEAVLGDAVRNRKLIRAFAYVIRSEGGEESKFFKALADLGFETREKDLKVFYSGAKKADWDVGIAMDVVRMVPKLDVVVLFSGDGDFVECVNYAQAQGVRVEVVSFRKSTSAELVEAADAFLDLGKDVKKYTFLR